MTRTIENLGALLLAVAFLLPVGDAPWFSFWREWSAAIAVLLMLLGAITTLRDHRLPLRLPVLSLPAAALGLAVVCWAQFAGGLVPYVSDALIASLYLVAFSLCAVVAGSLPLSYRERFADRLAMALAVAALISVPLAVLQWTGWLRLDLGMRVAGGRPVAHMEQANLLCSLLIQGVFGLWRLSARGRLGTRAAILLCAPLLLAIVLTQSRVAWLVALALLGAAAWRRDIFDWRRHGPGVLAIALFVVVGALALPWVNDRLGLIGAALSERFSEGRRPAIWSLFVDAATVYPWVGWGALQNGAAQFALADRHPSLGYFFSSAHSIGLDLMVWFGIPVGGLAAVALVTVVARRVAWASDIATLATALAAVALVLHGWVELPLHYAYFLLPLGLFVGATRIDRESAWGPALLVPTDVKVLLPGLSLLWALLLALLGREYIRIADVRPVLAIDKMTRHLVLEADSPNPDAMLLDQLKAFHAFAALPLGTGASAADLDAAKAAMTRAPYSASIERYALLAGINGRDAEARVALRRLCKFETPAQCLASQDAWTLWRRQWPGLPAWPATVGPN
jgi:hypothetical protein